MHFSSGSWEHLQWVAEAFRCMGIPGKWSHECPEQVAVDSCKVSNIRREDGTNNNVRITNVHLAIFTFESSQFNCCASHSYHFSGSESQKIVEEKQRKIDGARRSLQLLRSACIVWPNSASEVLLTGSFDGWTTQVNLISIRLIDYFPPMI